MIPLYMYGVEPIPTRVGAREGYAELISNIHDSFIQFTRCGLDCFQLEATKWEECGFTNEEPQRTQAIQGVDGGPGHYDAT